MNRNGYKDISIVGELTRDQFSNFLKEAGKVIPRGSRVDGYSTLLVSNETYDKVELDKLMTLCDKYSLGYVWNIEYGALYESGGKIEGVTLEVENFIEDQLVISAEYVEGLLRKLQEIHKVGVSGIPKYLEETKVEVRQYTKDCLEAGEALDPLDWYPLYLKNYSSLFNQSDKEFKVKGWSREDISAILEKELQIC